MPILQATASVVPLSATNDVVNVIGALNADHFWELNETGTGVFVDSGATGGWDFQYPTSGGDRYPVMRGVVGAVRGNPKVTCFAAPNTGAALRTADVQASRLSSEQGTVGLWMGFTTGTGGAIDPSLTFNPHIQGRYQQGASVRGVWRFGMLNDGSIYMRMNNNFTYITQWYWDDVNEVQAILKNSPTDSVISPFKMAFFCIVQRHDGNGPQLYINGQQVMSAPTTTFGGTNLAGQPSDDDSWWSDLDAAASGSTQTFYEFGRRARYQLLFISSTAYTSQQIADVYNSANTTGACTDLHEWINAWEPDFWKPPAIGTPGQTTAAGDWRSIWCEQNVANATNFDFVDLRWDYFSSWQPAGANISTVDWPGLSYNVGGVSSGSNTVVNEGSFWSGNGGTPSAQQWSSRWTAANGFDTGTLGMIFQIPVNTFGRLVLRFEHSVANTFFQIRCDNPSSNQFQIALQSGTGNNWIVNWDFPAPRGTTGFLVITQNGTPGAGVDVYWNGVLQSGGNISGTANGTFDGSEWFSDLTAAGQWRIRFPLPFSSFTTDWSDGLIYDLWIKRGTPLNSAQIVALYNLAVGTFPSLPPP